MKTVIVGGVAGGMSCATRLRRLDESAEIVVVERSGYVSYANCGLPYYVGGVIENRDSLLLQTPQSLHDRFAIDVRIGREVTVIDVAAKTVTIVDRATGDEVAESYDYLVLSPGAAPFVPQFPGSEQAIPLRNVADTDAMVEAIADARTAVVMGAGFIGLEVAENLRHRGLSVQVVELAGQVLPPLDVEMAAMVQTELVANKVTVHTGTSVTSYDGAVATLASGEKLPADVLVAAVGVRPDSTLASAAGLTVTDRGLIVVDDQLRTSDRSVFAVGDAIAKVDAVTGQPGPSYLANSANREGRRVADVIAGTAAPLPPVLNTAIVKVFSLVAAATGLTEARAIAAGRTVRVIHTHPSQHAGYYPGAAPMSLKLVIDADTDDILGAQAVGTEGVDKRIDVLATAMRGGISASDLVDLDLAYAPPFGSAKDPVNMLGYVADNLRTGVSHTIQWHELPEALSAGIQFIDVRTPAEFSRGSVPGAINIPVDDLRDRIAEVDDDVIVSCQVGIRGHTAARLLIAAGKRARNLDGGYRTWQAATVNDRP